MPTRCSLEADHQREATVVRLTQGALDEEGSAACVELARVAGGPGRRELRLDLAGVKCLTAAGLGRLVTLHRAARGRGARLVLTNVGPLLYEVLAVTRLTRLLDVRRASAGAAETARPRC